MYRHCVCLLILSYTKSLIRLRAKTCHKVNKKGASAPIQYRKDLGAYGLLCPRYRLEISNKR